jgi:hypothetical protein
LDDRDKELAALEQKREWILAQERRLAGFVAGRVIEKPELSIWMILIPIIFLHFFYRLNKVANGRKGFVHNFMITRQRALDAALEGLETGQVPNPNELCRMSSSPEATYGVYAAWLKVLLDHYGKLLQAEGNSADELIRSVYKTRANYLLFLHQLHRAEKQFDAALTPHLDASLRDVTTIIETMERQSDAYRREEADKIFP